MPHPNQNSSKNMPRLQFKHYVGAIKDLSSVTYGYLHVQLRSLNVADTRCLSALLRSARTLSEGRRGIAHYASIPLHLVPAFSAAVGPSSERPRSLGGPPRADGACPSGDRACPSADGPCQHADRPLRLVQRPSQRPAQLVTPIRIAGKLHPRVKDSWGNKKTQVVIN